MHYIHYLKKKQNHQKELLQLHRTCRLTFGFAEL